MSDYGCCRDCEYGEPPESGWKWHCTWYKTLEDPDKIQTDCLHFRPRGSGSSGCFLTTACCVYKGLPDDCHELQTMRRLRDEYILKQPYGKELVDDYYKEAPVIVAKINQNSEKDQILEDTYQKVLDIVTSVEAEKYDEAVIKYMILFHKLSRLQ